MKQKSVILAQYHNPKFAENGKEEKNTSKYAYEVLQTKNTMEVAVGEWIYPTQINKMIESGVEVTVKATK